MGREEYALINKRQKQPNEAQKQPYDNVFKRMVEHQTDVILPILFPELRGKTFEQQTIEMLMTSWRGDGVYKAIPNNPGERAEIVHVEYLVSPDEETEDTLLVYHGVLRKKYQARVTNTRVTTYLILPFRCSMPLPPFTETWPTGRPKLLFDYIQLRLWEWDARSFVEQGAIPAYGFLPCMDHTNASMLLKAIDDLLQWYGDGTELFRDELLCFRTLLRRARRLPEAELLRVEKRVSMYDQLLEEDPWVQQKIAEGKAKGKMEGKAEALKHALLAFVREKYPPLEELAEAKLARMSGLDALNVLLIQLFSAPNEYAVRDLLEAR